MTKDQINQKMAEIAGWKEVRIICKEIAGGRLIGWKPTNDPDYPMWDDGIRRRWADVPNYASDLNLVWEVELKLVEEGLGGLYTINL